MIGALLLFANILSNKISGRQGAPTLILFVAAGMVVGSDGSGLIHFTNTEFAETMGLTALVFFLFSGGLGTKRESVRPILWQGFAWATVGVLITAAILGLAMPVFTELKLMEGLLLGASFPRTENKDPPWPLPPPYSCCAHRSLRTSPTTPVAL